MTFSELGLPQFLLTAVTNLGFDTPTPIQEKIIPILLEKDTDVVGLAQTGTGKTAAFGLPLLAKIDVENHYPQGVIICPTRELAVQVQGDIINYAKNIKNINVVSIYGGASIDTQVRQLRRGAHIVVGTPGRMADMIKRGALKLDNIKYVILDEADEMLNMGFKEELDNILSTTPKEKSTWLFSATMPNEVLRIAKNYMNNPVQVESGKRNQGADTVQHFAYYVNRGEMYLALKRLLDFSPGIYGVVFANTRIQTQQIAEDLIRDGYNADSLHGDLSQGQRDKVMKQFREKNLQILVATDVAARGIDVDNLSHVIHYGIPQDMESYNHRSGRTGRAGKEGISLAIVDSRDSRKVRELSRMINKPINEGVVPTGKDICEKQLFHSIDKIKDTPVDIEKIGSYMTKVLKAFEDVTKEELLEKFVSKEFSAFLDYYSKNRDLNTRGQSETKAQLSNGTRFFINLGTEDSLNLEKFKEFVSLYTDIKPADVANVKMLDRFSFFEVENSLKLKVLNGFAVGVEHQGRKVNIEEAQQKQKSNYGSRRSFGGSDSGGGRREGGYSGNREGGGFRRRTDGSFGGRKTEGGSRVSSEGGYKPSGNGRSRGNLSQKRHQ